MAINLWRNIWETAAKRKACGNFKEFVWAFYSSKRWQFWEYPMDFIEQIHMSWEWKSRGWIASKMTSSGQLSNFS